MLARAITLEMNWTLDGLRCLPGPDDVRGCPCVYFLWNGARLQYIGATVGLGQRLYYWECAKRAPAWCDTYRAKIPFDRVTVLLSTREEYKRLEADLQRQFATPFNRQLGGGR